MNYPVRQTAVSAAVFFWMFSCLWWSASACGEDWRQWRGQDRDGVWHVEGVMQRLPEGQLPIAWSQGTLVDYPPGSTSKLRSHLDV